MIPNVARSYSAFVWRRRGRSLPSEIRSIPAAHGDRPEFAVGDRVGKSKVSKVGSLEKPMPPFSRAQGRIINKSDGAVHLKSRKICNEILP